MKRTSAWAPTVQATRTSGEKETEGDEQKVVAAVVVAEAEKEVAAGPYQQPRSSRNLGGARFAIGMCGMSEAFRVRRRKGALGCPDCSRQ